AFNFATNMMAYWKLATNALDSSGKGHNGTATGITYSGGYAQFGAGRYIDVADTTDLSFTDGTNDLPAHFLLAFIWSNRTGSQHLLSKRGTGTNREWWISGSGSTLTIYFSNPTNSPSNAWIE